VISPLFRFIKLERAAEVIKEDHPGALEPIRHASQEELTSLIELIARSNREEFPSIADQLTRRSATILVHAFERRLPEEVHEAISEVLALRPLPRQLTQAWVIFRTHPELPALLRGMYKIANALRPTQLEGEHSLRSLYDIWRSENVEKSLVVAMDQFDGTVSKWCETSWPADLAIDAGQPLHKHLKALVLAHGSSKLIRKHRHEELVAWFDFVPNRLFDDAGVNYIQTFDDSRWNRGILDRYIERHGLPAGGGRFWGRISPDKRKAIQRLVAGQLIAEFFTDIDDPSGRFQFWKKYIDQLVGIAYPPNRERVLLHFRRLLVVEFRDMGNAGYLYKEEHRARIARIVKSDSPHGACKISEIAIFRIIHNRNWQANTKAALDRIFN